MRLLYLCVLFILPVSSSQTCEENTCNTISDDVDAVIPKGANPQGLPLQADRQCIDRHPECDFFVASNECERNPGMHSCIGIVL